MCGICGLLDFTGAIANPMVIKTMADTLVHRGPDGEGFFVNSTSASAFSPHLCQASGPGSLAFGHRRLSIIDLDGGRQPLSNEDGTVWVTYNGEIYNFQELRRELIDRGHVFRTRCDTEVLVHGYEEWGGRCVERLRGMFAFAVWDAKRSELFLARDRVGIKPLYYYADKEKFVFASEIKAILASGMATPEIDPRALSDYLNLLYVPAPGSIFKNIRKLPPGHTLRVKAGKSPEPEKYWDLSFARVDETLSEEQWCEKLLAKLEEAVRIRLISDVPLGAFLSGGIDSSAVVALMSGLQETPVKTSSIGFSSDRFNELPYADQIVKRYHTDHHQAIVEADAVSLLDKLVWHYDEPFADSSAIPTYLVSKITRERVTVALSGDGGDENFAGYRRYYFDLLENRLREKIPGPLRRTLVAALARLYPKADWLPQMFRAKTLLTNLSLSPLEAYFNSMSWFGPYKSRILSPDLQAQVNAYSPAELFLSHGAACDSRDPLSRVQYVDIKSYLVDDILTKVDRASMANSLEVRVPLLDHEFMELAAQIPSSLKLRGKEGKYIFKKALEPSLPHSILYRPKMGFSIPLAEWLRGDLKELFGDIVSTASSPLRDLLDMDTVDEMWRKHLSGMSDFAPELWAVLFLARWREQFN